MLLDWLATAASASVKLKVAASNPSQFQEQKLTVKSYLPKGVRPENVIDAGGLEIGYDVKKGQCYAHKEVVLPAKESVVYYVEIDDIWLINPEELETQRQYAYKLRDQLLSSQYAEIAKNTVAEIELKIQSVLDKQDQNLIEKVPTIQHIGAYDFNKEIIEQIKEDIGILESMIMALLKSGGGSGSSGGKSAGSGKSLTQKSSPQSRPGQGTSPVGSNTIQQDMDQQIGAVSSQSGSFRIGSCLSQEAIRYANVQNVSLDAPENIKLAVTIQNPSNTESQNMPVRYYLAENVKVTDVIDAAGLDVGFDFERSLYYVYKDNVLLEPGEKKVYEIVLRNKWYVDKFYLFTLKVHADNVTNALEASKFGAAKDKNADIQSRLDQLLEAQPAPELTEEYVAAFEADQKNLNNVENEIRGLEETLIDSGALDLITPESKEKLCEEERDRKIVRAQKGAQAIKDFKVAASTIFVGKAPNRSTTWQLISGIIVFLGILSFSFYYVQIKEQKSTMLDPLTGVFSRGYIMERFQEELRIAKSTNTRCSLLVMDVDKFKTINDKYGHAIGDTILKEFVIAMRKGIRATDLMGRIGGDEFIVILPTGDKERARKIAEGIARIVERTVININQQMFRITTSIGVATYPDDSGTAKDMFDKADSALYVIKRKGGNGVSAV